MLPSYLTTAGLTLDLVASLLLIKALVLSREKAADLSRARWPSKSDAEQVEKNPLGKMLWEQSRTAKWALGLLTAGFMLQIMGSLFAIRVGSAG